MAIDPRISLAVQQANIAPAIDLFNRVKQQRIQNQRLPGQMLAQDLSNRLMEQQVARGGIDLENAENQRDIASLAQFSILNKDALQQANEGDSTALQQALQARIQQLGPERSQQSQEALQLIQAGQGQQAASLLGNSVDLAARSGLLNQSQLTAGQRDRQALITDLQSDDPNIVQSAKVALGIAPRAATSAQERIAASPDVTKQVAESEAQIAGAKEGATLEQQRQKLPDIKAAVKDAELTAKKQNEVFTDLNRAKAGLPGLEQVVGKLKELAPIATSTLSGKAFDFAAKELGFGGTKGATARAKFIATIDNQVLPLLRETFGAAFTAAEGDRLRDALADPDASPEAKIAQLEAFIEQKSRNIQTSESELKGLQGDNTQTIGRFTVEVID